MNLMRLMRFDNEQFGTVRVLQEGGELFFCAADLCRALGYSNHRDAVTRHVDEGDVVKRDTPTSSGVQSITYMNESGLYALIFGSKLETAKSFKKWVTSEVLPSIRKNGEYQIAKSIPNAEKVKVELMFIETAARMLNVSSSGKLGMLQSIQSAHGLPNLLPSYAVDAPSDAVDGNSRPTYSATEGLKAFGAGVSAKAFNQLLESHGLLQKMSRPSTKAPDKHREFWSVTSRGLLYGKNIVDPRCQRETQPHWFQSRFKELLGVVGLAGKVAA